MRTQALQGMFSGKNVSAAKPARWKRCVPRLRRLCVPPPYSHRNAIIGSTFVARRAGIQQASKATTISNAAIAPGEPFKGDLLIVLKPLERKGILEIWQDRKIEEGNEWRHEIETAMNEGEIALLFMSTHFLASSFIQDKELPACCNGAKEEGLGVV